MRRYWSYRADTIKLKLIILSKLLEGVIMQSGLNFTTIDFETVIANQNSGCAIALVVVDNGVIVEEFYSLIQSSNNIYQFVY